MGARALAFVTLALVLAASASLAAYQAESVSNGGTISGIVRYAGKPPTPARLAIGKDREVCGARPLYDQSLMVDKDGGIVNAVVTIPDLERGKPLKPASGIKFDQQGCEYTPHVIAFPAGSTIEVLNSDGILHSIHTESTINPVVDMAQPGFKKTIRITIEKPEIIKVTCDAHNWMEGWWYATANPYYAVTDAQGRYSISGVPPGTYTLEVWQEKLGISNQKIVVAPNSATRADFVLKPKS